MRIQLHRSEFFELRTRAAELELIDLQEIRALKELRERFAAQRREAGATLNALIDTLARAHGFNARQPFTLHDETCELEVTVKTEESPREAQA